MLLILKKTSLNLSGLSTKTISEPKIQETSTFQIVRCGKEQNKALLNCSGHEKNLKDTRIEMNRRFGMPFYIPLISLISCFLLSLRKGMKNYDLYKYIYFFIGFTILVCSEITVRYSGISFNHSLVYYLMPIGLFPIVYLYLI